MGVAGGGGRAEQPAAPFPDPSASAPTPARKSKEEVALQISERLAAIEAQQAAIEEKLQRVREAEADLPS